MIYLQRSTRTRKKLILPDFEYDSDYKSYTPDAPSRRAEIPKRPSLPKVSFEMLKYF